MPKTDALPEVARNGHVAPGFIAPLDDEWLTIEKGPYAGAEFKGWVNHPAPLWAQLFDQKSEEKRIAAYQALFLEHKNWCVRDRAGNVVPLPPFSDMKLFLDSVPQGWLNAMVGTMATAREQLPNSPTPESRPSGNT